MKVRVVLSLLLCVLVYMIAGGFVFNLLERDHEESLRTSTNDYLSVFLGKRIQYPTDAT